MNNALVLSHQRNCLLMMPLGPSVTCGDCFLSAIQTRLNMPLASNSELASSFSSLTSACSKTGFKVTNPATPKTSFIVRSATAAKPTRKDRVNTGHVADSGGPSPTATSGSSSQPTCVGTSYTVKKGDTCQSISQANGFSTAQLMAKNGLLGYCQILPVAGTTLCLPKNLRCTPHKLVNTDTCNSLAQRYNTTWVKMVSWNPELGTYCDRIPKLASFGFSICVSTPGGTWVHPYPEDEPATSTSTSTTETYFTIPSTAFTALPKPTQDPDQPNRAWVPVYGSGTREDCDVYMTPPIIWNSTLDYTCISTARAYHVSLADFLSWNPALKNQTATECGLSPDEQYCAQLKRLQPGTGPGVTPYCAQYGVSEPGSYQYGDCQSYLQSFSLSEATFKEWNGVGCDGFRSGYAYCVSAMHFRPAGKYDAVTHSLFPNCKTRTRAGLTIVFSFVKDKSRLATTGPWRIRQAALGAPSSCPNLASCRPVCWHGIRRSSRTAPAWSSTMITALGRQRGIRLDEFQG